MKVHVDIADLMRLDHEGYSVYGNVFTPGKIIIKRESFPEGKVPKPLEDYVGQAAELGKACRGRKGQAFIRCMQEEAVKRGIKKKK